MTTKEPLFPRDSRVQHVKTGNTYTIVGTPQRYRLESTGEPAYCYQADDGDPRIWVRDQKEMEDGRFVAVN